MNDNQIPKHINFLYQKIEKHNILYHREDNPIISDHEYDLLFRELKDLEKKYPQYKKDNSPTNEVGSNINAQFSEVVHPFPMYSLANAMNREELLEFVDKRKKELQVEKLRFAVSPKFDGLALELIYQNGFLMTAATRGNGEVGEDVTVNINQIENIPHSIEIKGRVIIRGEVIMEREEFKRINQERLKEDKPLFSNPRNAAAGSVRQLDSQITASRKLRFFAYQLANDKEIKEFLSKNENLNTISHCVSFLKKIGFDTNQYSLSLSSLKLIIDYYERMKTMRHTLNYNIDGIVIKLDSLEYQEKLGIAGKRPRFAVAWKFPPTVVETILKDVTFQVGRTGTITPVGELEPIGIDGAIVKRVTLHNEEEIKSKDLRMGDTVKVIRSGDVIPKIIAVVKENKRGEKIIVFPKNCPSCEQTLVKEKIYIRCINEFCISKQINQIRHFVSKEAMNIDGLGDELVAELINKNMISHVADLYTLKNDDLNQLDRVGNKMKSNLLSAIEKSKRIKLDRFIYALGIRGVGIKMAIDLSRNYLSIDKLMQTTEEKLLELDSVGEVTAKAIISFVNNAFYQKVIKLLLERGVMPYYENNYTRKTVFSNKKVIFTGKLSLPRHILKEKAEELGANIVSSLSSKTDFLIVGEDPGNKLKKADELGIKTINEKEFFDLSKIYNE